MAVRDYGFKGSLPVPDSRHYLGKQGAVFRMIMGYYFTVFQEMVELGLKGNDLLVFAAINNITQKGDGCFHGSTEALGKMVGIPRVSAARILKRLTEAGYLIKGEIYKNGVKFCTYQTRDILSQGVSKCYTDQCQNDTPDCIKMIHNNKSDNVVDKSTTKNIKIEREDAPASPSPSRRFTPPTVDEVREYCRSRHNAVNAEAFVAFYTSNGWKVGKNTMKDWKAAVITWEKRDQTHTTPVFTGYTRPTAR